MHINNLSAAWKSTVKPRVRGFLPVRLFPALSVGKLRRRQGLPPVMLEEGGNFDEVLWGSVSPWL